MKTCSFIISAVLVCITCAYGAAYRRLTETQWTGQVDRNWATNANWTNNAPDEGYHAIIPATTSSGRMPRLNNGETRKAGKLTVQTSGSNRGKIEVWGGSTLILGDGNAQTSTLDGDLYVGEDVNNSGVLKIDGDHTLQGAGGVIILTQMDNSRIDCNGGASDKLTIASSSTPCGSRSCSVVIRGEGEIHVELDNRGYVVSDTSCLKLVEVSKTGTSAGFWIVENNCDFHVDTTVTGACEWQSIDTDGTIGGAFKVESNGGLSGCVAATGPVTIQAGSLQCLEGNCCTTGKLTFESVAYGDSLTTEPYIYLASGRAATFGLGGAGTCASCTAHDCE